MVGEYVNNRKCKKKKKKKNHGFLAVAILIPFYM